MIESYTLRMRGGKEGGGKGALVQKELAGTLGAVNDQTLIVCFRVLPEDSNAMKSKNPQSGFYETEIAPCLDTTEQSPAKKQGGMAVVVYEAHRQDGRYNECKRVTPTLDAHMGTGGGNVPMTINKAQVRRLTPRECERLQGFPDDWTAIPWRGKDAEHCPDAPRYRAIGNSWCVPVISWPGQRIEEGLERCQQQKK